MMDGSKILWDLDGVLRDLCGKALGRQPDKWDDVNKDGKGVVEIINSDLTMLFTAKPTEYCMVAREFTPLVIASCQPESWRKQTTDWVWQHLHDAKLYFVKSIEEKLSMLEPGDTLVEDYPLFPTYENIILIDRPYNRVVKNAQRVTSPLALMNALRRKYDAE